MKVILITVYPTFVIIWNPGLAPGKNSDRAPEMGKH